MTRTERRALSERASFSNAHALGGWLTRSFPPPHSAFAVRGRRREPAPGIQLPLRHRQEVGLGPPGRSQGRRVTDSRCARDCHVMVVCMKMQLRARARGAAEHVALHRCPHAPSSPANTTNELISWWPPTCFQRGASAHACRPCRPCLLTWHAPPCPWLPPLPGPPSREH